MALLREKNILSPSRCSAASMSLHSLMSIRQTIRLTTLPAVSFWLDTAQSVTRSRPSLPLTLHSRRRLSARPSQRLHRIVPESDPYMPRAGRAFGTPVLAPYDGCTNPLVVQRTLAARSVADGQRGALLAAALKLTTLGLIAAAGLPGRVLYRHLRRDDDIYIDIRLALGLLPSGVPGAFRATFLGALMAARSATYNSAVTVLSIDFIPRARPQMDERHTTRAMRVSAAWVPQIARFPSLRQYFQAVLACLTPPVAAVFLAGVLWRGANARGAFGAALYVLALLGISRLQFLGVTGMDLAVSLAALALASLTRTPRSVQLGGLAILALTAAIVTPFW